MNDELTGTITFLTIVGSLIVALVAVISGAYIWHIYRLRHEEALFLQLLFRLCMTVTFGSAWIAIYLVLALVGHGLARPWGAVAIAIPVILMMQTVIQVARVWRRERRLTALTKTVSMPGNARGDGHEQGDG